MSVNSPPFKGSASTYFRHPRGKQEPRRRQPPFTASDPMGFESTGSALSVVASASLPSRNQTVPKPFKRRPMFLQVDLNSDLAALFVGNKVDSGHGFIVPQVNGFADSRLCFPLTIYNVLHYCR